MRPSPSHRMLTVASGLLLILSTGCASFKMVELALPTENISSRNISVGNIRAYAIDEEVLVAGSLYPRTGGVHHAPPGHIDITVFDSKDSPLMHAKTTYFPRPIDHRPRGGKERSHFAARIPVSPELLHRIRVTHHPKGISECSFSLL